MAYNNNTPLATDTIAQTQGTINGNFGFIQTDAQVEHIFNGNTGPLAVPQAEGTHIKASMPNMNDPGSLPTGCDGTYYVNGGKPKFYNAASGALFINQGTKLGGSQGTTGQTLNSSGLVIPVPANSAGTLYLYDAGRTPFDYIAVVAFFTTGTNTGATVLVASPSLTITTNLLTIEVTRSGSSTSASYAISYVTLV